MYVPGLPIAYRFPTPNVGWAAGFIDVGVMTPDAPPGDTVTGTAGVKISTG
jgi:hypothetical protein